MKVIKNKTIDFATAVQAPVINGNRAARTGYVRLVRLITDEPVPQQTSYTGKIVNSSSSHQSFSSLYFVSIFQRSK